jgi:hypothetical protein
MYFLLARGFGLRRLAALAGAIAFMFSDAFLTHFGNLNLNATMSWLPWIFWAWCGSLTRGDDAPPASRDAARPRHPLPRTLLTAVLLALAIAAGHIQGVLFIVLALALYTCARLYVHRRERAPAFRFVTELLSFGFVVLLAALLAAPVLLPALQLAAASARASWNYTATAGYSLSPAQLIGWLIPGFFGRGPQFHWGAWPRVEVGYLGVLPLILSAAAVLLRARTQGKLLWPWVALTAVTFVLALGIYAIPHGWLTLLPGFGQLRAPARFVFLTDFGLAALAAFGLHALWHASGDADHRLVARITSRLGLATAAVFAIVVPLAYLALLFVQDRDPAIVTRVSITLIAVVSFGLLLVASALWFWAHAKNLAARSTLAGLAVALIFVDVASLGAYQDLGNSDSTATYRHDEIAAFFASQPGPFRIDSRTQIESLWQPDTALIYGLQDVYGVSNPLILADFETYWQSLGSRSSPLYDLLNVRYVLGKKDVVLDWDKFTLAFEGDPQLNVFENGRALPAAFVVPTAQFQPTQELVLQAITAPGFDPTTTAVILGESTAPVSVGGAGTVTDIRPGRNALAFHANTDAPALIFVSQVWYPGWQVFVDGRPAGAPNRANYLFQAVSVPGGEHEVELRFAPTSWRTGWWLAAAASLFALFCIVLMTMIRRRQWRTDGD